MPLQVADFRRCVLRDGQLTLHWGGFVSHHDDQLSSEVLEIQLQNGYMDRNFWIGGEHSHIRSSPPTSG